MCQLSVVIGVRVINLGQILPPVSRLATIRELAGLHELAGFTIILVISIELLISVSIVYFAISFNQIQNLIMKRLRT